jgi:hypothetical protein
MQASFKRRRSLVQFKAGRQQRSRLVQLRDSKTKNAISYVRKNVAPAFQLPTKLLGHQNCI